MPKVAILLYKDTESCGYKYECTDIIPIQKSDWLTVTEDELTCLRTYYKPPPRKGYKLNHVILELGDREEIDLTLKNMMPVLLKKQEEDKLRKAKNAIIAKKRKATMEANKIEKKKAQLEKLKRELGDE